MPHSAVIRRAGIADAPGIARVHWDSHQTTYVQTGRVERARVEAWTMIDRVARWTANLAIANDVYPAPEGFHRMAIWVAVVDDDVVGWANTSLGYEPAAPRELQLEGLYVLDAHHGTGVGQSLLDAAIGDRPAYLWALADNPRAHAFYRRNGFELDGATQFDELWQITEVRFVR
jgi:GNAT superfamily N-acetyltransferase